MEVSAKINKNRIVMNLNSDADRSVFEEVFRDLDYKIVDTQIAGAGNLIIDIGAHIGCFSLYCRCLNSSVKILAYEPEAENFNNLKENIRKNNFHDIQVKNLAVSDRDGQKNIYISDDSHNHSLIKEIEHTNELKVQTIGINRILDRQELVDLIKIDCEGAEFEIIQTITPENFKKIKTLYIEYHEFNDRQNHQTLVDILKKNNFKISKKPSHYDRRMGFILAERF